MDNHNKNLSYGKAPVNLGQFELDKPDHGFALMHCQYLPIFMRDISTEHMKMPYQLPEEYEEYAGLISKCTMDANDGQIVRDPNKFPFKYIYLTAKRTWVEPGNPGNRPGWHADGFGSNGDLNYIWADMNPTEFAVQEYINVPETDMEMLKSINEQTKDDSIITFADKSLLKLDEEVIHRVGLNVERGYRTFFKLSMSNHKYNLEGNSYNFKLPHDWTMHSRTDLRNVDNKDFKH